MARTLTRYAVLGPLCLSIFIGVAGCSQSLPDTPKFADVVALPGRLLNSDQQKQMVDELAQKSATHQEEAAKVIEKAR